MATNLQVLNRLDHLASHYAVFEPDQVLTHGQLNSVSRYLDDQDRLTRVALLGVGLIGGLHLRLLDGAVQVSRGLGLTTDGDLLVLRQDTLYDRFRPYGTEDPAYGPFYSLPEGEGGERTFLFESLVQLLPVGESDVRARPLGELPDLKERVALLLMETVENDPDLCMGEDCDNLGRDCLHHQRLLLITPKDAERLQSSLPALQPTSERARALPEVAASRPTLGADLANVTQLAARYLQSLSNASPARGTIDRLQAAFKRLGTALPDVLQEWLGGDPTAQWSARLAGHLAAAQARPGTVPLALYNHAKELCDAFNAMREAFLAVDAVLLPDLAAFPKHLLLGRLDAPRQQRTGLYPAPLDGPSREAFARARFGLWQLQVLVESFFVPEDPLLRITPSAGEQRPLHERAIPWHYRVQAGAPGQGPGQLPVQSAWHYGRSATGREAENSGYRAALWGATGRALTPLAFNIAGADFFRIEGHLGQPVQQVDAELKRLIAAHNLPLQVHSVLLHTQRGGIQVRPGMRYTPLHSLHHLVRRDVALKLEEGEAFGRQYLTDITEAVAAKRILPASDSGESTLAHARTAQQAMQATSAAAAPALASGRYSSYKATPTSWKTSYTSALESVGNARVSLGHVSRNDLASPIDTLLSSSKPLWIDWLDELIQARNDRADDKLLFSAFVRPHPGIDHLGGCWRGGTFVLVYDDAGRVVADVTLPYPCAEEDEPEPEEPVLTRPPLRPPRLLDRAVRVVPALDFQIEERFTKVRDVINTDLKAQSANIEGLVKGVGLVSPTRSPTLPDIKGVLTLDPMVNTLAADLQRQKLGLDDLRARIAANDFKTPAAQEEAAKLLLTKEATLANSITETTARAVKSEVDTATPGGGALAEVLSDSASAVRDTGTLSTLKNGLGRIQVTPGGVGSKLVTGVVKARGLG